MSNSIPENVMTSVCYRNFLKTILNLEKEIEQSFRD